MLSKIIVSSYGILIEVALWLFLAGSIIGGFVAKGVLGGIIGLVGGFVVAVMFFGAFLVLGDIRRAVNQIQESIHKKA